MRYFRLHLKVYVRTSDSFKPTYAICKALNRSHTLQHVCGYNHMRFDTPFYMAQHNLSSYKVVYIEELEHLKGQDLTKEFCQNIKPPTKKQLEEMYFVDAL